MSWSEAKREGEKRGRCCGGVPETMTMLRWKQSKSEQERARAPGQAGGRRQARSQSEKSGRQNSNTTTTDRMRYEKLAITLTLSAGRNSIAAEQPLQTPMAAPHGQMTGSQGVCGRESQTGTGRQRRLLKTLKKQTRERSICMLLTSC